jgi:very-short-patch-repair endonuclease
MPCKSDTPDLAAARIAAKQHGVVTTRQLAAAGLGRMAVSERARSGRLHRVHHGVYAVGHRALSLHGRFMAAVLACGDGAALSHGSAAVLWGLLRPLEGPTHVTVPTTAGIRSRRGIHVHRSRSLNHYPRDDPSSSPSSNWQGGGRGGRLTTRRDRIPVTTIQRTIDDLASCTPPFPPHLLRRARRQAELKGIHLDGSERTRTRSDLEDAFLALWRRHRFPTPETNVQVGKWEVDFLWRRERLVVEADFFAYHRGAVAFEDDHARDLDLRRQGFAVHRYTDVQLESEPDQIVADVARALDD